MRAWLPALVLLVAIRVAAAQSVGASPLEDALGERVALVGTVTRATGGGGLQSFWLAHNTLYRRPVEGTVQVSARSAVTVVPGSQVRATGTLERLPGRSRDGTTGYDDRMLRLGVVAAMPGATFSVLAPPPAASVEAMTWRARMALAAGIRARVPEPEASILLGELVGIRSRLPATVESELVGSGLVHLLAVSGLKVALVASILSALLRPAGRRAALLGILGIGAYAIVGGASSAALRSALMGSLALFAQVLRRDPDPARSLLLVAAAMLLITPGLAGDLSFQYSFLGVAGIQLMQPALARRLQRLPRAAADGLAVTVAAQVATLPLTAAYFHVVSLSAPITNLLVIPTLGPTMAASAWLALGMPDPLGVVAAGATGSAHLLLALAAVGGGPGGAVLAVPWFGPTHALAYLAGLAVVVAARAHRLATRRVPRLLQGALATPVAGVAGGALVLLLLAAPDGRLHMDFLDTPGGGAVVTAPDGARLLLDAGASPVRLAAALDAELAPPRSRLDGLLLTSSGATAAGGADAALGRSPTIYLAPADTAGDVPQRVGAMLAGRGTRVHWIAPGDVVRWHGVELEFGTCGAGLAATLRFGRATAWLCSAGSADDPGTLPPGPLTVVDAGPGQVNPQGDWASAAWVVAHGTRSPAGVLSGGVLGPRLWRPPRDGPLSLSCDGQTCRRQ